RIKSDRSRGGLVQRISYQNVCMKNVGDPILLDTRYTTFPGDKIPVYRDIVLRDVTSLTGGGLTFLGFDDKNRIGVTLDAVHVADAARDLRAEHAEIKIGPRRGNVRPQGDDVAVSDGGARDSRPLDCARRFVPFPAPGPAPLSATVTPPEDPTLFVA